MNITLPLKENWFRLTESGIKPEDYRDITPYWCSRLLLFNGEKKSKIWWSDEFFENEKPIQEFEENVSLFCSFKHFNNNIMTLGYPKSTDTSRIVIYKHAGMCIREGNKAWGAEEGKIYFVIKHGERK